MSDANSLDDWYSTRLKVVCLIEREGAVDTEYVVHVFRAPDRQSALSKALELGASHESSCKNDAGQVVNWRFAEVLTLDLLGSADLDGREVHSLLTSEADPAPFDLEYRPDLSEPGESGVPIVNASPISDA